MYHSMFCGYFSQKNICSKEIQTINTSKTIKIDSTLKITSADVCVFNFPHYFPLSLFLFIFSLFPITFPHNLMCLLILYVIIYFHFHIAHFRSLERFSRYTCTFPSNSTKHLNRNWNGNFRKKNLFQKLRLWEVSMLINTHFFKSKILKKQQQ